MNVCFSKVQAYTNVRLRALHLTGVVTIYFCEFLTINSWQHNSQTLEFHYSPHLLFIHSLFLKLLMWLSYIYSHKVLNVCLKVTSITSLKLLKYLEIHYVFIFDRPYFTLYYVFLLIYMFDVNLYAIWNPSSTVI